VKKVFCVGKYISDVTIIHYNANRYELKFVIGNLDSFEKVYNLKRYHHDIKGGKETQNLNFICVSKLAAKSCRAFDIFTSNGIADPVKQRNQIMTSVYMLKINDNILYNNDFLFAFLTLNFHFNILQGILFYISN